MDHSSLSRTQHTPEFLLSILESTYAGIVTCDVHGFVNYANSKAEEILSMSYNDYQAVGRYHTDRPFRYPENNQPLKREELPILRALQGELIRNQELLLEKPDGQIRLISVGGNPLYDSNKKLIGAMISMVDVTDIRSKSQELISQNKRLQESVIERTSILQDMNVALGRSQSRFRTIVEQSPVGIQIFNTKGKTILLNPAWKKIFNLPEEFIQNFIMKEYNVLEDPLLVKNGVDKIVRRSFEGETNKIPAFYYDPQAVGHDFKGKWIESIMYPLKQADGSVREIVLIHNDVTEIYESREHKHRFLATQNFLADVSEKLISNLDLGKNMENVASALIPFFCDGVFVDMLEGDRINRIITKHRNPETERLMNEIKKFFNPTVESPQPTGRVIRSGEPELLENVDFKIIAKHTVNTEHAELIQKIGIRSHIATPLKFQNEVIGALNFLITTERRHFDEQDMAVSVELARRAAIAFSNARLYKEAQTAVQQRDDFISIASHELKTPITSLKLQHEVIMKAVRDAHLESEDSRFATKAASNANRQLDRLTRLVEDMLDISRISTGKLAMNFTNTDFTHVIKEVIERFEYQLKTLGIELKITQLVQTTIHADPYRMEQVLTNLLSNAIRYGEKKPILISLINENERVVFKIKDHGMGIAKQDQERIFNRFERALSFNELSGLGLGLFISRQIVEDHGGELLVESSPGLGSTFSMILKSI